MEHSIAAKYAARPAARFVRPSTRVRERRLGLRPSGSFQRAGPPRDGAARPGGRAACPPARRLARDPAGASRSDRRSGRPRPLGDHGVGPVRATRRGPPPGRRVGAVARLRTVDRHLRRRDRRSLRVGPAVARRRQPPPRARRADLDAAQGHARTRARPARRRRSARSRRRPGSTVRITGAARRRSSTGSSSPGRGSTRPSTTS